MITLLFAGDLVPPQAVNNIYSEELIQVLAEKDFSIVNLECPLTTHNAPISKTGNNFKRNPETIRHIKKGAFDAVCLSNNHILDYGHQGVMDTIDICNQNGIKTVGAGSNLKEAQKPLHIILKGKKICILNYSEREFNIATHSSGGANPYSDITVYYDIEREKRENDFVIVVYHGGLEYHHYPTPEIVQKFKYMIDVGAHAVISHHTHRYSGSIVYNDKPLLFGLGNFLLPAKNKVQKNWYQGILAKLTIENQRITHTIVPIMSSKDFSKINLLEKNEHKKILLKFRELSKSISDEVFLQDYWKNIYRLNERNVINRIKSHSYFEYKLRKHFLKIFKPKINNYKLNLTLNNLRCDSHRENMTRVLEQSKQK